MSQKDLRKILSQEPKILYPLDAFEECLVMDIDTNFATTCSINNVIVPSLIIKCDQTSLIKYGIAFSPSQPGLQFRMIDMARKDFVIEIVLHFDNSAKMRLHLDPANELVHHFMSQLKSTAFISFHFFSYEKGTFISSITDIDDEHIDWVNRNLKLVSNLDANNRSGMITEFLISQSNASNDKIYKFNDVYNRKYLVEFADAFVRFQNDKFVKM